MLIYILLALFGASFIPSVREWLMPKMKWILLFFGIILTIFQGLFIFMVSTKLSTLYKDLGVSPNPLIIPLEIVGLLISLLLIAAGIFDQKLPKTTLFFYLKFALIFFVTLVFSLEVIFLISGIYQISSTY